MLRLGRSEVPRYCAQLRVECFCFLFWLCILHDVQWVVVMLAIHVDSEFMISESEQQEAYRRMIWLPLTFLMLERVWDS